MTPRMYRRLAGLVLFVAPFLAAVIAPTPLPGQAGDKLPKIDAKKHQDFKEKITDQVSFDMIAIPGGTYLMGSPEKEEGRDPHEGPQRPVTVGPFWMGKCEVTWNEYDLYWMKKGEANTVAAFNKVADAVSRPTPPYADETFGHGRDMQPALCMTVHAAQEYCRWLSGVTGKHYRLPTEAEWEWACRAGTTTAYSFGNDATKLGDYAWFGDNSDDTTHKVAQKKPNPWGLYDMHGNIAEWCFDLYAKDTYSKLPLDKASINPVVMPTNKRYSHVVRGGSWSQAAERCRSASRNFSEKDWLRRDPQRPQSIWWMTDADFVGFRVIRPMDENDKLKGYKSKITRESDDY